MSQPENTSTKNGKAPKDIVPEGSAAQETTWEGTAPQDATLEDPELECTASGTALEDIAPQNQPTSSATSRRNRCLSPPPETRQIFYCNLQRQRATQGAAPNNRPNLSATSTRNWLLYLPPEIRIIIYHYVLELSDGTPHCDKFLRYTRCIQIDLKRGR